MAESAALVSIVEAQRQWVNRRGVEVDSKNRTASLEDNLFRPLSSQAKRDFGAGAGHELEGDMNSLRSSSALVVNVFDPLGGPNAGAIHEALGGDGRAQHLSFEAPYPTGLGGTPPHLDVTLTGADSRPVAVEAKFAEVYGPVHNTLQAVYVERESLWESAPRSREMASQLCQGSLRFEFLGAAQLLKHSIGLRRTFGPDGFRLVYLWYEVAGDEASRHRRELEKFTNALSSELDFEAITYQSLWPKLSHLAAPAHTAYLAERYGL